MSKKHFESFARHIRDLVEAGRIVEAKACYDMIVHCQDNGRFDRGRFYAACGFEVEVRRVA